MRNDAVVTFGRVLEGFMNSGAGKLATLWFDQLHLELGTILNSGVIWMEGGQTPDFEQWKRHVIASEEPDAKDDVIDAIVTRWIPSPIDAGDGLLPRQFEEVIEAAATEEVDASAVTAHLHPIDRMKESHAARANLRRVLRSWLPVSQDVALLGDSLERAAMRRLSAFGGHASAHRTFCDVVVKQVPDLSTLTWKDIAELRHHAGFDAFRSKVLELDGLIAQGAVRDAGVLCEHLFQEALVELAKQVRPNLTRCIIKGIIGNLPIPLINPAGLAFSVQDAITTARLGKRHAWTYFLIDLQGMAGVSRRQGRNQ